MQHVCLQVRVEQQIYAVDLGMMEERAAGAITGTLDDYTRKMARPDLGKERPG
jgi:hypothetical protein